MTTIAKLKEQARLHEQNEEWEMAIRAYEQVLRRSEQEDGDPELNLLNRVGDLHVRLGRRKDAVHYYEDAADRYAEAGFYNNAIALCNKALRYAPERAELYRNLGRYSSEQGFLTDARRWFLEYAERKQTAGEMGDVFDALEEFTGLSEDAEVREVLANRLEAQGQPSEALGQLKRAYELRALAGDTDAAELLKAKILNLDPGADLPNPMPSEAGADGSGAGGSRATAAPPLPGLDVHTALEEARLGFDDEHEAATGTEPSDDWTDDASSIMTDASNDRTWSESDSGEAASGVEEAAARDVSSDDLGLIPTRIADEIEDEPPDERTSDAAIEDAPRDPGPEADGLLDLQSLGFAADGGTADGHGAAGDEGSGPLEEAPSLDASVAAADNVGADEIGLHEIVLDEVGADEVGVDEVGVDEVGVDEVGVDDVGVDDVGVDEIVLDEVVLDEVGADDVGMDEIGADEVDDVADEPLPFLDTTDDFDHEMEAASAGDPPAVEETHVQGGAGADAPRQMPGADAGEDYVDLAGFITDEDSIPAGAADEGDTDSESDDDDFSELLSQFKSKAIEHGEEGDPSSHYDLGLAFKEMGLIDEAIAELHKALRSGQEQLKVFEELGLCLMIREQYDLAARILTRGLEVPRTDDAELLGVYYHLGRCYEELGRKEDARDAFQRVVDLDGNFRDISERLARL